jgi:hypothetical protein
LRPGKTVSPQTTSPSLNWHQSEFGYALMSSCPIFVIAGLVPAVRLFKIKTWTPAKPA